MKPAEVDLYRGKLTAVPEYEPVSQVIVSKGLENPAFDKAIENAGAKVIKLGGENLWARDWGPISTKMSGKLVLADFNYFEGKDGDGIPNYQPTAIAEFLHISRVSLPIYLEGGNFMNTHDGLCAFSKRVLNQQQFESGKRNKVIFGADSEKISDIFTSFLGFKKIEYFDEMPWESTGQFDLRSKFIADNAV